ncbi:XrtA system polysaccharide deacetylase [Mesorhizobium muleiense]|uniref:Chitooligosaccharide deacetylase n=1 Tax=Mesorhizobium muleiense TaxID=1004279 RepID=A0A1G8L4M9_9HYPH|nr:XrtA system polysaccharide deacetylase [Mesorhizobium muleiense]MCF6100419.1 polysaccharide deacetylase family protein [Mesorhizobium muleiense]SDI50507.1 polysaccharide deacetylase family protein, PEP-CTERM locus subfamily [Mesorhizobium muleiense]
MDEKPPRCLLTIDVEDWFHSYNYGNLVSKEHWRDYEGHVEQNTLRILEVLDRSGVRGTFFILGWVAEHYSGLVRRIANAGHEVASHGYGHDPVYSLTPDQFRSDVRRSKDVLEDIVGRPIEGYRAPCFSITNWALPILRELGFTYDSSFFPTTTHDRYGRLEGINVGSGLVEVHDGFFEVCISCLHTARFAVPWGGGGYFRLFPYGLWLGGVRRILRSGVPYVFYIHPWEIDPDPPQVPGLKGLRALRQRVNLTRCEARLAALLGAFPWCPITEAIDDLATMARPQIDLGLTARPPRPVAASGRPRCAD